MIGQAVSAALFVGRWCVERVPLRPRLAVMRAQMVLGRDLILRSLAFQACFLSAAAVASRFGAAAVAAHQVVLQLWNFVALTLDSLAIAAQALVGAALGAGHAPGATRLAWRITAMVDGVRDWCWPLVFAAGHAVIPELFTADPAVLDQVGGGVVVLRRHHAGRRRRVRARRRAARRGRCRLPAQRDAGLRIGRIPPADLAVAACCDWGLAGIWTGLTVFMVLRMLAVVWRAASGRWAVVGSDLQTRHGSDSDPAAEHDRKGS